MWNFQSSNGAYVLILSLHFDAFFFFLRDFIFKTLFYFLYFFIFLMPRMGGGAPYSPIIEGGG